MNSNEKIRSSAPSDNPDSVAAKEEYLGNDKLTNPYAEEFQEFIQNQRDRISKSPDANERQYKKELRKNEKAYHDLIFDKTEYGKQTHAAEAKLERYKKLLENRIQETPEARANRFEEYKKTMESRGEETLDADQVQERFNNQNLLNTNKIREQIKAQEQIISNLHQDFEDSLAVASPEDEEALANWRKRQDELEAEFRLKQQNSKGDSGQQPDLNQSQNQDTQATDGTKDNQNIHRTSEQDRNAIIIENEDDSIKRLRTKDYLDSDEGKSEQALETKFDQLSDKLDDMVEKNEITIEQRNEKLDQAMEVFLNEVDKIRSDYENRTRGNLVARWLGIISSDKAPVKPNTTNQPTGNTDNNKPPVDDANKDKKAPAGDTDKNNSDKKDNDKAPDTTDDKPNQSDDKKIDKEAVKKELADLKSRREKLTAKMEKQGGFEEILSMVSKIRKRLHAITKEMLDRNIDVHEMGIVKRSYRDQLYEQYDWMDRKIVRVLTSNAEYNGKRDDAKFSRIWNNLTEEQKQEIRQRQSQWLDQDNKQGQAFRQWLKNNSQI